MLAMTMPGCGEAEAPSTSTDTNSDTGAGAASSASESGSTSFNAGHVRMQEELAAIQKSVVRENRFLGDAELISFQKQLDLFPGDAERRVDLLVEIAVHQLKLGRARKSIQSFNEAQKLLPQLSGRSRPRATMRVLFGQGLAYLRLGETSNCVDCHSVDSCILPIRGSGTHEFKEGSRGAVAAFLDLLRQPSLPAAVQSKARWLLNIAAMTLGEYPGAVPEEHRIPERVFEAQADFTRFRDVASDVGLDSFNLSGGAVIEDFDGDNRLDVLTSTWDYSGGMHSFQNPGTGRFEERTAAAGLEGFTGGLNMVHADYDNDGDADVLVLRGAWFDALGRHPNSLLQNDGSGRFTDVSFASGMGETHYPTQAAAWADYDLDGDLDLYVANEAGERHVFPSQLFRNSLNEGLPSSAAFQDVARQSGVENLRYSKGVSWGDYDDDGLPDLYVSNYTDPNRLYQNQGDGRFEDVASASAVLDPIQSFVPWFWDYNNDGLLDLYVAAYVEDVSQNIAGMLGEPHAGQSGRLYKGDGAGGFEDVTDACGLSALVTTMGASYGDLDNDGWLDFYLGTGYPSYEALTPNVMYRNVDGQRFEDVSIAGGFSHLQKGHAVVFADLDDDGDQDVFQQMGGAYLGDSFHDVLYENPGHGNHWLRLKLVGSTSNRSGLGVRLRVDFTEQGKARSIHRRLPVSGSFGSAPLQHHLGLGKAASIDRLTLQWPASGVEQVFEAVPVDRAYQVHEDEDAMRPLQLSPFQFQQPKGSR